MGRFTIQLFDRAGDGMQTSFRIQPVLSDGSNFATLSGYADAFQAALLDVTDGEVGMASLAREFRAPVYPPPNTDGNAVVRDQWVARYTDTVTMKTYTARVPTAEEPNATPLTLPDGSKILALDLASGKGLALKNAWDAFVYSEDGNPTALNMVFLRK